MEYVKRYLQECRQAHSSSVHSAQATPRFSFELNRMASQVAEVLPYVPHDAILRDLGQFSGSVVSLSGSVFNSLSIMKMIFCHKTGYDGSFTFVDLIHDSCFTLSRG